MRTFVQQQTQAPPALSANLARPRAGRRMSQTNAEEAESGIARIEAPRFGNDFSRIPAHSPAAATFPAAAPVPQFNVTRPPSTAPPIQRQPLSRSAVESPGAAAFPQEREARRSSPFITGERLLSGSPQQSSQPLPFLDTIQRSFGHHNLAHVQAHTDRGAAADAWALGAEAFTRGVDVTFARPPTLHTAAHEAAHVIQQRAGVAVSGGYGQVGDAYERHADAVADRVVHGHSSEDLLDAAPGPAAHSPILTAPVVQMRRIPPNVRALLTATTGGNGPNFLANEEGALRLIDLAMEELTAAERAKVTTRRLGTLTEAQFKALPRLERRSRYVEAILAEFPDRTLGDPKLIDTGPRPATADAANITKVVNHADTIFAAIATGAQDANITQVFGAAKLAAAKTKYAEGRKWMNDLHAADKIVTDRSGYSEEVSQGGLTGFHKIIRVAKDVIDSPDKNDSIVILLHESMHAGNVAIKDDVYNGAPGFQTQQPDEKIANSAHFEVVPWRILDPRDPRAFPVLPLPPPPAPPTAFQPFVPAGTTSAGITAPPRTPAEEGANAAYKRVNKAWALGLNLFHAYLHLFRTPTDWTVPVGDFGGMRLDKSLPFWSKVQKLTIHRKAIIDPTSADEAKRPVSQIDLALSEGLTRRLGFVMDVLDPLGTEAKVFAFENTNSTAAERAAAFPGGAHTNPDTERDFLIKLAVRHPNVISLTGNTARDLRVVRQMSDPTFGGLWSNILAPRDPVSFPD